VFVAAGGTDRQGYGIPLPLPERSPGGAKKEGPGFGPPPKKKDGISSPGGSDSATDKAEILEAVLNFYDKFAEQNTQTAELQFEAAKASRRVCEAYVVMLKQPDKAVAAYRRAVGLLEPLVAQSPGNEAWRAELVMTYAIAPVEAFPNDRDAPMRRAFELAEGNAWLTGLLKLRIGFAREQSGDRAGAETAYCEAVDLLAAIVSSHRTEQSHIDLASARYQLANLFLKQQKAQEARELLELSAEEFRPFAERLPPRFHVGREW